MPSIPGWVYASTRDLGSASLEVGAFSFLVLMHLVLSFLPSVSKFFFPEKFDKYIEFILFSSNEFAFILVILNTTTHGGEIYEGLLRKRKEVF